jgi:hypothetical protein
VKKTTLEQTILAQAQRRDSKLTGGRRPNEEVRTTYSVGSDARRALRILAAVLDCPANDLISIALEDLLMAYGSLPFSHTRTELRQRLAQMAGSQSPKKMPGS